MYFAPLLREQLHIRPKTDAISVCKCIASIMRHAKPGKKKKKERERKGRKRKKVKVNKRKEKTNRKGKGKKQRKDKEKENNRKKEEPRAVPLSQEAFVGTE